MSNPVAEMKEAIEALDAPEVEEVEAVEESVEVEISPEEESARRNGWSPKEEWRGDPDDWVNAREFNRRGELFGKIKSLERDRDSLRQATDHMKELLAKAKETEYNRAVRELKAEKKSAAAEGETTRMLEIDDQMEELKKDFDSYQAQVNKTPEQPQINDAFINWQQQNQWYTQDSEMRTFADTSGLSYAQLNPNASPTEVFAHVDKQIRRAFPERFENPKRNSPSKVEAVPASGKATSKAKYSEKDLNPDQRSIMNTMIRSGVMSKQEYLDELHRIGEI